METRFLQTLLMVVQTGSLAESARRLHITPSAVIQRIRALEEEIGHALIQRAGHRMRVTAAGAAVLDEINSLLAVEARIKALASLDTESGLLKVGVVHTMLTGLFPDLLERLRRNRPGIELYILPGTSNDLFKQVVEEKVDIALIIQPPFAIPKALEWKLVRSEPLILITPMTIAGTDVHSILRAEPFIRYDRNNWGGRIVDLYLRDHDLALKELFELDALEAIILLVSRGLGVSLIPDWLPPWPEGVSVKRFQIAGARTRDLGMLWSKSSPRLPLIKAFFAEGIAAIGRLRDATSATSAPHSPT